MIIIVPHVCESSSISLQLIAFTCPWSPAIFQFNELKTWVTESLLPAYIYPEHYHKSLKMVTIHNVSV